MNLFNALITISIFATVFQCVVSDGVISFNRKQEKDSQSQLCEDKSTKCTNMQTCCATKFNSHNCCPYKNAVCCSDKYQCCPEGTICDLRNKKCISSSQYTDMYVHGERVDQPHDLTPSRKVNYIDSMLKLGKQCSNNKYKCPGEKKCCTMLGGGFGCCKFDKGVCCSDMKTCCPHGTECDVTNGKCITPPVNLVPIPKNDPEIIKVESRTVCPNKKVECRTFETCCSVGYDSYGCCPFKNATCCSDMQSCCPHGKKCDLKKKMCIPGNELSSDIVERKSLINYVYNVGLKNVCPDQTKCRGNETCCETRHNSYGCCPYDFGVCCPDKMSCCNEGYTCVESGCKKVVL